MTAQQDEQDADPVVVAGVYPYFPCSQCSATMYQTTELLDQWFVYGVIECAYCVAHFDLQDALVASLTAHPTSPLNTCLFGARSTDSVIVLPPNDSLVLDLRSLGFAADADLLYVGATPYHGAGWPCIVSWGRLYPVQFRDSKIVLYGRPHATFTNGEGTPAQPDDFGPPRFVFGSPRDDGTEGAFAEDMGENSILLTVVACEAGEATTRHLASAAMKFQSAQHLESIVPANVAAETAICALVRDVLGQHSSRTILDGFMEAATYGHCLNMLLGVCAALLRLPRLAESTRIALNRLRKLRNGMAHSGGVAASPTIHELAQFLVASFLAVRYVEFLRRHTPMPVQGASKGAPPSGVGPRHR